MLMAFLKMTLMKFKTDKIYIEIVVSIDSLLLWLNNRCRLRPACTHLWAWLSVTN